MVSHTHPSRCALSIFTWTPSKCTTSFLHLTPSSLETFIHFTCLLQMYPHHKKVVWCWTATVAVFQTAELKQQQSFHTTILILYYFCTFPIPNQAFLRWIESSYLTRAERMIQARKTKHWIDLKQIHMNTPIWAKLGNTTYKKKVLFFMSLILHCKIGKNITWLLLEINIHWYPLTNCNTNQGTECR